jgi:Glycopeptide antibiotics resistance protein
MLVPFGILMPLLFVKQRKTGVFIITLIIFNLGIEIFQYYTRLGSFDVDDLILNSLGALIAYMMVRIVLSMTYLKKISKPM